MLRLCVVMVLCLAYVAVASKRRQQGNNRFLTPQQQANLQNIFQGAVSGHQGGGGGGNGGFGGGQGGFGGGHGGGHGGFGGGQGGLGGGHGGGHGGFGGGHGGHGGQGGFGGGHGGFGGGQGGFGGGHGGFGGSSGGHHGSQHGGGSCRKYCKRNNRYQCCDNLQKPAKPGVCPPRRPSCPGLRTTRPQYCEDDYDCRGVDKCCPDACLTESDVCKSPSNNYGR